MKKLVCRLIKEERGNVLVLVALLMFVFIGITAVAIDGGRLYMEKSILQKAADAGALAGAQELPGNSISAEAIAKDVATQNNALASTVQIDSNAMWIRVTTNSTVDLTFGKIFGYSTVPVKATAKVELNPLTSGTGVIPIGIDMAKYEDWKECTTVVLKISNPSEETDKCTGSDFGAGNTGPLQITGNGGNIYREDLKYGAKREVLIGEILETETGGKAGPTKQAVNYRKKACSDTDYDPNNPDCERIVILPVYEIHSWQNKNKVKDVRVVGFATFFILGEPDAKDEDESKNGAEVKGKFIEFTASGDSSPSQPNYGAYGYKLVE